MRSFGIGLLEGLAKSTSKGINDAMNTLDDRVSRLSEKRINRQINEQGRFDKDFRNNEEEMKSLVAALGPDGAGIMHTLINENSYNGAKAIVPLVVKKMGETNMSASQILKYKAADGSTPPSVKQLANLVTVPLNMPDLDAGTSLEGSGTHILNIFSNSEDGVSKYANRRIKSDMALAGVSNKTTNYGELSAAGTLTVDRFELGMSNNLKENLKKINAAIVSAEEGSSKQKELKNRKYQLETTINNGFDKILTGPQIKSNTAVHSDMFGKFAMVDGQINYLSNTWIPADIQAANVKTSMLAGEEATDILQWTKNNRGESNASAKALVPMSIPNDIQGLDGLEGEYMSADRFIKALAHSGYRAKIVPRDGDVDPYITIGGKIEFDFDAINKAKKAKGINTNDNKVVNPPNTTVFNKGTNNNTNFNLTTGKTTFNDKALNVAKNKFAFSNASMQKVHAKTLRNRLQTLYPNQDYKTLFKEFTNTSWKPEFDN